MAKNKEAYYKSHTQLHIFNLKKNDLPTPLQRATIIYFTQCIETLPKYTSITFIYTRTAFSTIFRPWQCFIKALKKLMIQLWFKREKSAFTATRSLEFVWVWTERRTNTWRFYQRQRDRWDSDQGQDSAIDRLSASVCPQWTLHKSLCVLHPPLTSTKNRTFWLIKKSAWMASFLWLHLSHIC